LVDLDKSFEYDDFFNTLKLKIKELWGNKRMVVNDLQIKSQITKEKAFLNAPCGTKVHDRND
jgi:hypothetical protein